MTRDLQSIIGCAKNIGGVEGEEGNRYSADSLIRKYPEFAVSDQGSTYRYRIWGSTPTCTQRRGSYPTGYEGGFSQRVIFLKASERDRLISIYMRWAPQQTLCLLVCVCLKLGKIWFSENHNLIVLERLACDSFSQSTSILWKDKGFPLPTSRLHGILTWFWLIKPCQAFGAVLISFLYSRTITATLLRWPLTTHSALLAYKKEKRFCQGLGPSTANSSLPSLQTLHVLLPQSSLLILLPLHPQRGKVIPGLQLSKHPRSGR